MSLRESSETLRPFRHARGEGAIVFDAHALPQTPDPAWFDAGHWGADAQPVGSGGRGAAWFIDAAWGAMVPQLQSIRMVTTSRFMPTV